MAAQLQDYELAVLYAMHPPADGAEGEAIRQQATRLCDEIKAPGGGWQVALQLFASSRRPEARLFALTAVQEALGPRPGVPPHAGADARQAMRDALLRWLRDPSSLAVPLVQEERYVRTKLGVVLALLVKNDYPERWSGAFQDLAGALLCGDNPSPVLVDLFFRVLSALDEEVVTFHVDRSPAELEHNTLIKDVMRYVHRGAKGGPEQQRRGGRDAQ